MMPSARVQDVPHYTELRSEAKLGTYKTDVLVKELYQDGTFKLAERSPQNRMRAAVNEAARTSIENARRELIEEPDRREQALFFVASLRKLQILTRQIKRVQTDLAFDRIRPIFESELEDFADEDDWQETIENLKQKLTACGDEIDNFLKMTKPIDSRRERTKYDVLGAAFIQEMQFTWGLFTSPNGKWSKDWTKPPRQDHKWQFARLLDAAWYDLGLASSGSRSRSPAERWYDRLRR